MATETKLVRVSIQVAVGDGEPLEVGFVHVTPENRAEPIAELLEALAASWRTMGVTL